MTAVATLPDVDLEALVAEPLPPCEVRVGPGEGLGAAFEALPPCGRPAVAVFTFTCHGPCRDPWRRSACAGHVADLGRFQDCCGYCGADLRTEVSS